MINYFAGIDIFNLSIVGCSIVLGIAALLVALMLVLHCHVIYYDSDEGKEEIHREKHSWLSRVAIHSANKKGKRLIGWSKSPDGSRPLTKHKVVLFHTIKLYAIWVDVTITETVAVPEKPRTRITKPKDVDYSEGIFVKFNYIDTQSDEVLATEGFRLDATAPDGAVDGWGFAPDGEVLFKDRNSNCVFNINLYPVTALDDSDIVASDEDFDGQSIVEVTYNLSGEGRVVYKEAHYVKLQLPANFNEDEKFIGWSVVPDGDVVIERGDIDSVFTIPLYSIGVEEIEEPVVEEEIEEPVVEEVIEEPVVEEVIEEPVVEEVIEEPVVEEVIEEPVVEEVVEKPLYEEVVEEYIPQPVIEEVIEEPVIEEPVVEEVVEEPVVEEVVEEPVVEEPVVEEIAVEEPALEASVDDADLVLVPTYYDNEGNKIDIRYSRSFTANLIQSEETVKDYYSELKNHIMSYKGVKSRISWKFDSYNRGRDQLFKIKLRGKTICLYCALDPNEFDESKYHHEPIDAKIFEDVPMLVKIKSGLGLRKAKELVDITMAKFGIEKDEKAKVVDYVAKYPYEPNEPLLARKLIKALVADDTMVVMSSKPKEEPVVEEVIEEPVVEEVVEEEIVIEAPIIEPELVVPEVTAEEAHHIIEEKHIELVLEEGVDYINAKDNKKAIINIDTLSKNYRAGEDVTIQSMKDKKLIDKKAKCVKVLARGILDKPLKVRAGEFSETAIEMILLTGGHPMHVVYKIK